jgi:hypothetical protein
MENLTVQQKIEKLLEMKVTRVRKNLKNVIIWDKLDRTNLTAIRKSIVRYSEPTSPKHFLFISGIKELDLI